MRNLFIDLDGVLADFDGFYERQFGVRPDRLVYDPPGFWEPVAMHGRFFADVPPMSDAMELWDGVNRLHGNPVILTGLPHSIVDAEAQKRDWVRRHISPDVKVVCCRSRDKRLHGQPGDILVDDWARYRHLWEEMGGVFVLHTSAADSLKVVGALLADVAR